nr:MAG TPA: hypothetical protein [Caudoviricetes sp.]
MKVFTENDKNYLYFLQGYAIIKMVRKEPHKIRLSKKRRIKK